MSEKNTNTIYRVFDKKDRYHQSYSPKLKGSRRWAVDCASSVQGRVEECVLDESNLTESVKVIFQFKNG